MTERKDVILAGCGNMGFAMLRGWLDAGILQPQYVFVVEPNAELRKRAADSGVHAFSDASAMPRDLRPALIILAVKPQVMADVLPAYRSHAAAGATMVSIAAGTRIATIEDLLGAGTAVIRVMPNTPAAVGAGMMVMYANSAVGVSAMNFAKKLMAASGEVAEVADEALMDAVTAVSGSGPAYLFHMIEALTEAAKSAGLPDDIAGLLAGQTIYGAAEYWKKSGVAPGTLRQQVTSPNGTTAAALAVLMQEERMTKLMTEAVDAARRRSIELGV
jgi:pyrroline-5-carboxylate reductase